jgi:ABC-type antimicrobial peptide transport system permease subunit
LYSVEAWVTYFNGDRFPKEYLSASLTDLLAGQSPEIEEMTRIAERDYTFVSGDKTFTEKGLYADSNFFNLFTFPLIHHGNGNILSEVNSIVISERMAIKFFGNTGCVGKTLLMKDGETEKAFNISAIFKQVTKQSHLQFDFIIPFSKFLAENNRALEAGATANQTWILLKDNVDKEIVENKIKNLIKNQESTLNQELFMFPLKEKILYSYAGGRRVWNEMQNIIIAGSVGFGILLIACFNYINLAIALNIRRYREAGIKKAVGAGKSAIVSQYLGETLILTMISLFFAIIFARILLTGFNAMLNFDIHLRLTDFKLIALFAAITLLTGLISGLPPAMYLASSNPVDALKGKILTSHSYSFFRQSLIVFQFTIPVILIICMLIIRSQDTFMRNYDLGVDKEKTIIMNNTINIQEHALSVKNELLTIPGIEAVSFTNCIPGRGAKVSSEVTWNGKDVTEKLHFWCINSDLDYNKTVKVNIADGRFFSAAYSTDLSACLINDVAARVMNYKDPVGSVINIEGQKSTIIGVFKDFHAIDLAGPLVPAIIRIIPDDQSYILIKYTTGSFQTISEEIRSVFGHYDSETPFQVTLVRDLISYSNLNLPARLSGIAFIIAILLACMGLFGLASFTAENRTKEIGVRKINGATTLSVMRLLLKGYNRWLTIAIVTALPLAFLLGKIFLGRFNFHTPMPVWAFLTGPAIALIVALLTVVVQTGRAAARNPVKALRYE